MGSIKASLLDKLQQTTFPTRSLIMIFGCSLGVAVASFFLLSVMILITNREATNSSLFLRPVLLGFNAFPPNSSLISWSLSLPNATLSSCCDTNATLLGNFTHNIEDGVKGNKTHVGNENVNDGMQFGNLKLKLKNVERNYSRNSGPYDTSLSLRKGIYDDIGDNIMEKECDIFDGRWERDEKLPYYPPGSCPHIDRDFNCHLNGRPDKEFYSWRWKPNGCDIPRLNGSHFLESCRGKKVVFVGDSLNRNMWESLVCILRLSIQNKTRVYEVSGKREFKKEGFYAFRFEDYNCSIDYVRAPFLVKESSFPGKNGSFATLRLDVMDETTKMYRDAHVLVFNTGHWWTHEKTSRGKDYYQEGNHVYDRLKVEEAYRRALTTWGKWVDSNVDGNRTLVFFRGYSITHFRGGQWNSGGQCHEESEPIFNETYLGRYPPKMRVVEDVLNQMKTRVIYLNISSLTDYRKDAHPSIYTNSYRNAKQLTQPQDCSHWCLPGVPDIWNHLFYASLFKADLGLPAIPN